MHLRIQNIECYSYHGCLKEETVIGGKFSVDVIIDYDFSKAIASDNLDDAIDYCVIHDLVRSEMNIPSKLIEHVAGRIKNKIVAHYTSIQNIKVIVTKFNPPVNGFIEKVAVEV
ncbi:MAG: dihydroneopterin aldolase [Bacteroidia bacterium]